MPSLLPANWVNTIVPSGARVATSTTSNGAAAPDGSRQVYGKVVVDLRNGKIWGFPTLTADSPYPVDQVNSAPPTSHPFLLGKYAFGDTDK